MSDCIIDLQDLVHVEGKSIRSVFCYEVHLTAMISVVSVLHQYGISITSLVDLSKFGCRFLCTQKWLPISKMACIIPWYSASRGTYVITS